MCASRLSLAALAAFLIADTAAAADTCKGGPKSQWKTADQAKDAATGRGYAGIVKVLIEDGCYEVVTVNDAGRIVGIQFDPVTLTLEKIEDPR
jgi:hypothetical protein